MIVPRGGPQRGCEMIRFRCVGCGKKLKAQEELSGKLFQCPKCGRSVQVPIEPAFEELESELDVDAGFPTPKLPAPEKEKPTSDSHAPSFVGTRPRPVQSRGPAQPGELTIGLRITVWVICCLVTVVNLFVYSEMTTEANAIQQAGAAAGHCLWIIGAYVLARAIDSLTRIG